MKNQRFFQKLPALVLSLGVTALGARWMLYLKAADHKGLLVPGHPLEYLLWALTAGALVLIFFSLGRRPLSPAPEGAPAVPAAIGHLLAAAGILISVLPWEPLMPGSLGTVWKVLGLLSAPCLLAAGFCRLTGRKSFFLLHLIPALFLVFHIINHYQQWSGQPQLLNYFHSFLGSAALVFFCFYSGSREVDIPHQRSRAIMGLAAVFLCTVGLYASGRDFWLYAGCILWILTDLGPLIPQTPPETAP